jgi:hypothetical protein
MGLFAVFCWYAAVSPNQKRKRLPRRGRSKRHDGTVPVENPASTLDAKAGQPRKGKKGQGKEKAE